LKKDATCKLGFTSAAVRMLAYGVADDLVDEYMHMSESSLKSIYRFCKAMVQVFAPYYPREPNEADTTRPLAFNEARGFRGMLRSIDCMHWEWENCPFAWKGKFKDHSERAIVILEAVLDLAFLLWHGRNP
jgi:hypothetical protein